MASFICLHLPCHGSCCHLVAQTATKTCWTWLVPPRGVDWLCPNRHHTTACPALAAAAAAAAAAATLFWNSSDSMMDRGISTEQSQASNARPHQSWHRRLTVPSQPANTAPAVSLITHNYRGLSIVCAIIVSTAPQQELLLGWILLPAQLLPKWYRYYREITREKNPDCWYISTINRIDVFLLHFLHIAAFYSSIPYL